MDKRTVERFTMQIPATVFVEDGDLERVLTLETDNISSGGTFPSTDELVPEGAKVELELYLPLDKLRALLGPAERVRVTVRGTVVRTQRDGVAVEFDRGYRIRSFSPSVDQVADSGAMEAR